MSLMLNRSLIKVNLVKESATVFSEQSCLNVF